MAKFNDMQKLVELFNPKLNESDSEEEFETTSSKLETPHATQRVKKSDERKRNPYDKLDSTKQTVNENINAEEEDEYFYRTEDAEKDWKNCPVWDISYKQQVSAEDVFLQMGLKHPGSASCEAMIISIQLPGENRQNIDLKILKDKMVLNSPKFYLDLTLPHPVDPQRGNAQFDSKSEKLIVTLRMDREFDVVNF